MQDAMNLAMRLERSGAMSWRGGTGELEPARRIDLLPHLSGAFDLAERQPIGHATRVAHIAVAIARELGMHAADRRTVINVALVHGAGAALPSATLEDSAWAADALGLEERVRYAVRVFGENWDGSNNDGAMLDAPAETLLVRAAHWAVDAADSEHNPLRARAELQRATAEELRATMGSEVSTALANVLADDETWMVLWSPGLPDLVAQSGAGEGRASLRKVEHTTAAMGTVIDAAIREPRRAARISGLARELARRLELSPGRARAIGVAAQLLDIGQLGVPRLINDKPSILSVDEMEVMRRHPSLGASILEHAPGFGEIARWVGMHHERIDGRGYPDMLDDEELPLEARVLSIADGYWALRARRPYRQAMTHAEATDLIEGASGDQYDQDVVVHLRPAIRDASVDYTAAGD
jgi:HD-GYP domain-containing protein (c-di-GMP phosphodiesterase class II)